MTNSMPPAVVAADQISRREGGRRLTGRNRSRDDRPLVSILMFCRNAGETLQRALDSAMAQTYPNTEIIVVDGGSEDGTVDRLTRHDTDIDYWLSEPDSCASDGQNKTLALMTGAYFFFLNSDDWVDPDYVETCMTAIQSSRADFVFGDAESYRNGAWDKTIHGSSAFETTMPRYHSIPTITAFYSRRFYELCGPVDCAYKTASDYEWFLRALSRGLKGHYTPAIRAHMTFGGRSAPQSWAAGLKVAMHPETRDIRIAYGVHPLRATMAHAEDVARFIASRLLTSLGMERIRRFLPRSIRR